MRIVAITTLCLLSGLVGAQSFNKGSHVIDLGASFGLYGGKASTNDTTTRTPAGASVFPVIYQYGIIDQLGIGAEFRYQNFITGNDSDAIDKAFALNYGAHVGYQLGRGKRVNFELGLGSGYGTIDFKGTDDNNKLYRIRGDGWYLHTDATLRIYFSDYVGMKLSGGYAHYSYSFKFASEDGISLDEPDEGWPKLQLNGAEMSIGLVIRIPGPQETKASTD